MLQCMFLLIYSAHNSAVTVLGQFAGQKKIHPCDGKAKFLF